MAFLLADNAITTLSAGISNSDTVLTVVTGAGASFPVLTGGADFTILTLENASGLRELVKCNYRNGDIFGSVTYPLTRAYGGSTARAWNAGDIVDLRVNSQAFEELKKASVITNVAAGTVAATNVQDAINELDTEKQVKITASGMLKGDGSGGITAAVSNTDYLPVTSPAMGGTPTAPTAAKATANTQIATTLFARAWGVPVGSVISLLSQVAPSEVNPDGSSAWVLANGQTLNRVTYAALFEFSKQGQSIPQAPFGTGDGATTFTVPDLRGYFLRGYSASLSTWGVAQADQNKLHNHSGSSATSSGVTSGGGSQGVRTDIPQETAADTVAQPITTTLSIANDGGAEARPINYPVSYFIKT